ncbi:collagenase [Thalassotalea profundi]|uniref:microbial collagenase n=1 Tax=Thalassotalea profundi TaxID=2036687 RepID=A0ABQ3IS27_9GAMM|nr:collagenase [Thalassotalea profundi]GHE92950.1 hypothetical protein GCM10011501_22870 [Thalassotalea profundi]
MKINNLLVATCLLMVGANTYAEQMQKTPKPPQTSNREVIDHHGVPNKKINIRAPSKDRITLPTPTQTFTHSKHIKNKVSIANAVATSCDVNAFATSNSTSLINELKLQGPNCINELFSASSNIQASTYTSNNMFAVANHVKTLSTNYAGGGDTDIEGLFLYLRAGYYVEFYNDNVSFVSWVKPAVKSAIDAFVNNANFYQNNDAHGKTLSEVLITMDSSEQQDVYLPIVKEWLSRWDQSYADKWNMRGAVNNIFTILFRGQYNANFVSLVATDTTLVSRLNNFTQQTWMINSDSEFLIANAARELGRLKMSQYGTAIQATVDAGLNAIFSSYVKYGNGDAVWLGAADTATYYANCSTYNICDYDVELKALALSQTHVCSPTLKILSQDLTPTQQASACTTLSAQETYFHTKTESGNIPIPGDNNTQLHINIFNSSEDYGKYAGPIFNIDTNNGGMYLEGDPSVVGNVPNFVAYEASYADAPHYVWNLEHEYVHYLDGRFNLFGSFNSPTEEVVWWAEGVAEYVANKNDNQAAIDTIHDGSTYTLSTIFETTYDGFDQDRIYRWGYLAVRFMFENHFDEVKSMIGETRAGDWSAYKTRINRWASDYGTEFTNWTQTVTSSGGGSDNNNAPTANANGPYTAEIDSTITFNSNGSIDTDGSIVNYHWDFGDGTSSTLANPTHSYSVANSYTATLTVTDDQGATAVASADVIISAEPSLEILNGGTKSNLTANIGQTTDTFFINVPTNASNLVINISGGSGDADLYVQQGSAPSDNNYTCRPYIGGNIETCTIATPAEGTWFINLKAYNTFSGVTLTASFDEAQTTPNVAPVVYINGPYSGDEGVAVAFNSTGSYDPDGSISSFHWSFGDGTTSTLENPTHVYATANTYNVSLSITDNEGLTETSSTTAIIEAVAPVSNVIDACEIQGAQSNGEVFDDTTICLGQTNTTWLHIAEVNNHNSIAISTAHGTGDLAIEFSNLGWPNSSNIQGSSNNAGNDECIYLTNLSHYWGYIKVSGASAGAALVVDFDTAGCR